MSFTKKVICDMKSLTVDFHRCYAKKSEVIILNRENKLLFGKLTETKKEKVKRLKNEVPSNSTTSVSDVDIRKSDQNAELYWMKNLSSIVPLKTYGMAAPPVTQNLNVEEVEIQTTKPDSVQERSVAPPVTKLKDKTSRTGMSKKKNAEKPPIVESKNGGQHVEKPQPIPFSSMLLRAMVTHPLINNAAPTQQLEIHDKSYLTPSVTRILAATLSENAREALISWKLKQIAEMGEEAFIKMQKAHLSTGKLFHSALHNYFQSGLAVPLDATDVGVEGCWRSVSPVLPRITTPMLVEAEVKHPYLLYKGIVDCVAEIDGSLSVIEWKKSDKPKSTLSSTFDAPVQLCAYIGALNSNNRLESSIERGVVVIAYTDGSPADVHKLDVSTVHNYWRSWLLRLQQYWIHYRNGTLPDPI